jgi:single-strand DNA-binding protein
MSGFDINHVTVSGHLTAPPELRHLPSGGAVCQLRIAHNERYKDGAGDWTDRPAYFDVTIWSGLGEWIAANVAKGEKVVVAGRLRWREWERDDERRQAVDITADSVIPIPRAPVEPEPDQVAAKAKAPRNAKPATATAA